MLVKVATGLIYWCRDNPEVLSAFMIANIIKIKTAKSENLKPYSYTISLHLTQMPFLFPLCFYHPHHRVKKLIILTVRNMTLCVVCSHRNKENTSLWYRVFDTYFAIRKRFFLAGTVLTDVEQGGFPWCIVNIMYQLIVALYSNMDLDTW